MAKRAIELFKEAAVQLQKEAEYLALQGTMKANDEDEALQALIGDFNLARVDLNTELSKSSEEKDAKRVEELNQRVNTLYGEIMNHDKMKAYNEAKSEMDSMINWIQSVISTAVNGGDPMLVEQEEEGGGCCGGSCGSCGGCH